jgi:hypothetical protein
MRLDLGFLFEGLAGASEDLRVVKGQGWGILERKPGHVSGVAGSPRP